MPKNMRSIILLLALLCGFHTSAIADTEKAEGYEKLYKQLMDLEPNDKQAVNIKDAVLQRDVGQFHLKKGKLFLCKPVELADGSERIVAAAFEGEGEFIFTPPTDIERAHLARFYEDKTTLEQEFNFLFLIFADTTEIELARRFEFKKERMSHDLKRNVDNALKYMGDKDTKTFNYEMMKTFLEDKQNDLFYAHFSEKKYEPMFFHINPFEVEEVRFMQRPKDNQVQHLRETISQFHAQAEYDSLANGLLSETDLARQTRRLIDIEAYEIDCRIESTSGFFSSVNPTVTVDMRLTFRPVQPDQRWIYFWFSPELEIKELTWLDDRPIPFFREEESPIFWLETDSLAVATEPLTIKMQYEGDELIERYDNYFLVKHSTFWYPRHDFQDKANFDLTFHVTKDFIFSAVGEPDTLETTDKMVSTAWHTSHQLRNVSFNLGFFNEHVVSAGAEADTLPPITIYMDKDDRKARGKRVGEDVGKSIDFFTSIIGEPPAKSFRVLEVPTYHGEAFVGLINLSWATYEGDNSWGYDAIYRAHEVAHQWWGVGVDFKSYHDQWMSEGFAEYCGLWYLQVAREDQDNYENQLENWRDAILNNRKFVFGSGQEAGPIWLGYRTRSSDTRGDYGLIIYKKGAWVLHMLRHLLIDLEEGSDDRFQAMLQDFYNTYLFQQATTRDFQEIVDKHFERDMGWFFEQWVYGTGVPTYRFAHRQERQVDGSFVVKGQVRQENVPDDFQMLIPVKVELADGEFVRERVLVSGPVTEFELAPVSSEPKKVIFNDLDAVLGEVKSMDWNEK